MTASDEIWTYYDGDWHDAPLYDRNLPDVGDHDLGVRYMQSW